MRKLKYDLLTEEEKEHLRKTNICPGLKEYVAWIKKQNQEKVKENNKIAENENKDDADAIDITKKKDVKLTYS